ncbi:MAG: hypothetical protein JWN34_4343 [Bryobacterales bacterium]|nr:hypothetical protein [Bryobacterales bacterium]
MLAQEQPYSWRAIRTFLLAWLLGAVFVSRFGLLHRSVPSPQFLLVGMTALFALVVWRVPAIHNALWNCDIRVLIGVHVSRFVGLYFLELYNEGRLPYDFAVKGGIGDIVVATLALIVLIMPRQVPFRRQAIQIWNVIGLIDILFVVATAARINFSNPASLNELRTLPMSLLPTFLVPIIIVTHMIIALRTFTASSSR